MCAGMRRVPHFENQPLSIREARLTMVRGARVRAHTLRTTRPPPEKLLQALQTSARGAWARATSCQGSASIREGGCARRRGESHVLRTARPQSVKLLQI
eukprot:1275086-Pyramimonas_sp.AAC.1